MINDPMPMKIRHAVCTLAVALLGAAIQAEEMSVADLPATRPVDNTPKLAYGLMMKQGDRLLYAPCRDRSFAQVEDVSPGGSLGQVLDSLGVNTGKRLYAELIGVLDNGVLKASSFNMLRVEGRCQMPGGKDETWRAAGNDPAWALALGGELVQLQRYGQPEVALPFTAMEAAGEVAQYRVTDGGHALAIRFEKRLCRDTQANAAFAWTARVEIDGQVLEGCAWQR